MNGFGGCWLLSLSIIVLLLQGILNADGVVRDENGVKSGVFLSPKFEMYPGSVVNKFFHNIDFPRGHIALKDFHAEVVDDMGNPVPLYETYIHHWYVARYYARINPQNSVNGDEEYYQADNITVRNSGICQGVINRQYFGFGSETRRTVTPIPEPYGLEIGNPEAVPEGYEERWMLNVHAINTRGAVDTLGCTECRREFYNVTVDEFGRPLHPAYAGGLLCCYDETRCKVRPGFQGLKKAYHLRYSAKWVDWRDSILPIRIYIFDVTDTRFRMKGDNTPVQDCKVEYQVEACEATGVPEIDNACIDSKKTTVVMPKGGYVIYGVAHQHYAGTGAALYREDGRLICTSRPFYGTSKKVGDEVDNVVGMSTCYPKPGSLKISDGEILILESNYSSTRQHTGVMGLFYVHIADSVPNDHFDFLQTPLHQMLSSTAKLYKYYWVLVILGVAVAIVAGIRYKRRKEIEEGYQQIGI